MTDAIRCTRCTAHFDRALLVFAAIRGNWIEIDGFWFCGDCHAFAPLIVQLDRERNAHQVTMLKLEQAQDAIVELHRHAAIGAAMDRAAPAITGQSATDVNRELDLHTRIYPNRDFDPSGGHP